MTGNRHILLLIDDDEVCLTFGKEILENRYTVYPVLSGEQAFTILKKITPDIILLDIEMPGMDGYAVLNILKNTPETQEIPVIFLTSYKDPGNELDGLNLGAVDYITKPFSPLLLVQRIENQLLLNSRRKELLSSNEILRKTVDEQSVKIEKLQSVLQKTVKTMEKYGVNKDEIKGLDIDALIDAM